MGPISHLFSTFRTTAGTFFADHSKVFMRVALAVGGVAFGFFAVGFAARWFNSSGNHNRHNHSSPRSGSFSSGSSQFSNDVNRVEEIKGELLALVRLRDLFDTDKKVQYEGLLDRFTDMNRSPSSSDIREADSFLDSIKKDKRILEDRELKVQQDEQLKEALLEDQLREVQKAEEKQMQQEVKELQSKIVKATKALEVQINSLEPHRQCWTQISNIVFHKSSIENLGEFFSQIETHRVKQEKQVDMTSPNDCFSDQVVSLDSQLSGKEGVFKTEKERLHSTYDLYLDSLEQVKERLAWVRLKDYHSEVGEEFLKSHLNMDLLKKIREGKELPKPVTATSSSERSEGKREIE